MGRFAVVLLAISVRSATFAQGVNAPAERTESSADSHGPSSLAPASADGLSDAQIARLRELEDQVMCACKTENWSRSLANCSEGCADPQKRQLRESVLADKSDEQILAAMKERYGSRVLAAPSWQGAGKWTYLLPPIVLGLAIVIAVVVLRSWRRQTLTAHGARREATPVDAGELQRVERELDELDR
ncbi:MAG: cytochrome c-type biogenesis protein CcmH [Planctomycetota bacterium]